MGSDLSELTRVLRENGWALHARANGQHSVLVELRDATDDDAEPIDTFAAPTLEAAFEQLLGA
jgi:hypothetical protein